VSELSYVDEPCADAPGYTYIRTDFCLRANGANAARDGTPPLAQFGA
jgi:hypothetical protein